MRRFGRLIASIADLLRRIVPGRGLRSLAARRRALEGYLTHYKTQAISLAGRLHGGSITIEAWYGAMRDELKHLHVNALILARGGNRAAVTFAEWGRLGGHMRVQYRYLTRYAQAIQNSAMDALQGGQFYSQKYLEWRSQLYGGSARASFYRGVAQGMLPQVPGDGQTACLTNCKCELRFEEGDQPGLVFVWWELRPAEHCEDCVALSEEWTPYEIWLPLGLSAHEWVTWLPKMSVSLVKTRAPFIELGGSEDE